MHASDVENSFCPIPVMEEEQTAADEIKDAEPTHTVAASIKQKPPPESSEAIRIRRLVILSFWAVVICLGLPVWLWTTSIHRATLPLQEMLNWADGKVIHLRIQAAPHADL